MSSQNNENKQKVLLVEDNDQIRGLMQKFFAKANQNKHLDCVLIAAKDGKEGYQMIVKHQPDLIISNIRLPIVDGFKMLSAFRRNYLKTSPYGVFCFLTASNEEKGKAFKAGANGYLPKNDLDYFTLIMNIRNWLRQAFLERSLQIKRELQIFQPEE